MGGRSPSLGASRQWTCSPATSPSRSATTTPAVLPPGPRFPSVPTRSPTTARRRLRAVRDRLSAEYGRPRLRPHRAPIDELVLTVLSQNTGDRNRDIAYARLRERFASWADVRDAETADVEEAIRPGGLGPTKARRIQAILRELGDDDLARLTAPEDAYAVHVLLIRHGRRTCTARAPRCGECPLLRMCPYGRERMRQLR